MKLAGCDEDNGGGAAAGRTEICTESAGRCRLSSDPRVSPLLCAALESEESCCRCCCCCCCCCCCASPTTSGSCMTCGCGGEPKFPPTLPEVEREAAEHGCVPGTSWEARISPCDCGAPK